MVPISSVAMLFADTTARSNNTVDLDIGAPRRNNEVKASVRWKLGTNLPYACVVGDIFCRLDSVVFGV